MRGFSAGLGAVLALFVGAGTAGAVPHEGRDDGGAHRLPQWMPAALVEPVPGAWPAQAAGGTRMARALEEQFYCPGLGSGPAAWEPGAGAGPGWFPGGWRTWDDEC